jgi:glycosyltransferase involved in cell wall biosynthesis
MKILIASWTPRRREGGVAGVIWNVANALQARGHRVECLFVEDLLRQPFSPARFESAAFAWVLARKILREFSSFDVVNLHSPCGFIYGVMRRTCWRGGPPFVMTMHGLEQRRVYAMRREAKKGHAWHFSWKNRAWRRAYYQPQFDLAIRTADESIVLNREAWSYLQLCYKREGDRVTYIPNGVEEKFFVAREYPERIAPRLLIVGSWLDQRGIYYLREALQILANQLPAVRLTIAGCSVNEGIVRQFFGTRLEQNIEVIPFLPSGQMPSIYAAHDVFVFPSLMEGLPLVLLEAMAGGMPVVTTETCGMPDIVQDDVNGLLVPPANGEAIAEAIVRLHCSRELRRRLGLAAQAHMRNYTWEKIAVRVEAVFEHAARGRKS